MNSFILDSAYQVGTCEIDIEGADGDAEHGYISE